MHGVPGARAKEGSVKFALSFLNNANSTKSKTNIFWILPTVEIILHKHCLWCLWQISCLHQHLLGYIEKILSLLRFKHICLPFAGMVFNIPIHFLWWLSLRCRHQNVKLQQMDSWSFELHNQIVTKTVTKTVLKTVAATDTKTVTKTAAATETKTVTKTVTMTKSKTVTQTVTTTKTKAVTKKEKDNMSNYSRRTLDPPNPTTRQWQQWQMLVLESGQINTHCILSEQKHVSPNSGKWGWTKFLAHEVILARRNWKLKLNLRYCAHFSTKIEFFSQVERMVLVA